MGSMGFPTMNNYTTCACLLSSKVIVTNVCVKAKPHFPGIRLQSVIIYINFFKNTTARMTNHTDSTEELVF